MSRRCHHGSPRHVPLGRIPRRPATATPERPAPPTSLAAPTTRPVPAAHAPRAFDRVEAAEPVEQLGPIETAAPVEQVEPIVAAESTVMPESIVEPAAAERPAASVPAPRPMPPRELGPRPAPGPAPRPAAAHEPAPARPEGEDGAIERTATAPQLRRFIKSRAYVPMHELRRRFAINGGDDDVTPVDIERKRVFVGLPEHEGRLLGELLRAGDIGYELSMDPISPIVVGVYPMRPVTRS